MALAFKKTAVFSYLAADIFIGSIVKKRMSGSVTGYFVTAVKLTVKVGIDKLRILQKLRKLLLKARVIQMKRTAKAVFVKHFHKAHVLNPSVVIAEGNAPLLAVLPKGCFNKFHRFTPYIGSIHKYYHIPSAKATKN